MNRLVMISLVVALACSPKPAEEKVPDAEPPPAKAVAHVKEIEKWRTDRVTRLTSESGWLTLVGLQWLNEGENTLVIPASGGTVTLKNDVVTLAANPSLQIDGKAVTTPTVLLDDTTDKEPTVVQTGTIRFNAIKRADKVGIRVKDSSSEARKNFRGIDYFPISDAWRVEARFEPDNPPKHVVITNILGMTTDEVSPGLLAFTIDGREYKVQPILERGEKDFFIIFKDATSGKETYAAARFVYAAPPDAGGRTVIDFNKAYNPPCAFTTFATCPLPPAQNRLPFAVDAGEKKYAGAVD